MAKRTNGRGIVDMNIYEKLEALQQEFKAPKTEYNSHGGFKYRTLEKMEETLKPLLKKHRALLIFSDTLEESGGRPHVVAHCQLIDLDDVDKEVNVRASAQEAEVQKGMQQAQISGSTSSYARKYALSALLLVDDTDEVDKKEGDQTDWQGEIDNAKDVKSLMRIFVRMDAGAKKNFTEALSVKKKELEDATT
jgi:hypothetical protein